MIIDFTYPTLTSEGWQIHVIKASKTNNLISKDIKFKTKKEAFDYYVHVHKLWQYERLQERIKSYKAQQHYNSK